MSKPADLPRLIGDLIREGIITSIDLDGGTCRVAMGDLETGDIPWLASRIGKTRVWSPPSVGEQVAILAPEGDTARAIVIGSLASEANPFPARDGSTTILFEDGAKLIYDPASHTLDAALPGGSTVRIVADTIEITGKVRIDGTLDVTQLITGADDVKAGEISLAHHKHGLVKAGTDKSGEPV